MISPSISPAATTSSLLVKEQVRQHGLAYSDGSDLQLRWPEDDCAHPRNWPLWTKVFNTAVVISLDFFTTMISTVGGAAAKNGRDENNMSPVFSIFAYTSVYLYGQAAGSLFFSPISESFGRKPLYIIAMFLDSGLELVIGTGPHISAIIVGRFFSGLLSTIPTNVVAGSIEDMYGPERRVWTIFAWGVAANIGLTIGPIYSTYISKAIGWRWVFWIAAIVELAQGIIALFLKESRPSQILKKRLHLLNQATNSETPFTINNPDKSLSWHDFITNSLTRPTRLFFMEPIVLLVTIMCAMDFGQIYLFTEALPAIYTQAPLSFTAKQASLSFIPIAVGLGLNIIPRFYDHNFLKRTKGRNEVIKPEHKIRGFIIGAPMLAIGLWWFAWTIPPSVPAPWPVSFLPLILVGFATNEFDCTLAGYMTDSYTIFSASAFASLAFVRAVVSGSLPLFANQMYEGLGANKATTILAALATACCGAPVLFLKYGERLRERSTFARYSREAEKRMGSLVKEGGDSVGTMRSGESRLDEPRKTRTISMFQ